MMILGHFFVRLDPQAIQFVNVIQEHVLGLDWLERQWRGIFHHKIGRGDRVQELQTAIQWIIGSVCWEGHSVPVKCSKLNDRVLVWNAFHAWTSRCALRKSLPAILRGWEARSQSPHRWIDVTMPGAWDWSFTHPCWTHMETNILWPPTHFIHRSVLLVFLEYCSMYCSWPRSHN